MKTFRVTFYETNKANRFIKAESEEQVKELLGITDDNKVIADQDKWPHSPLYVELGWVQDQVLRIEEQEVSDE